MVIDMHGDIFQSTCQVLGNPVNCIGPMGAGLAKSFRERFKGLEDSWKEHCSSGSAFPGEAYLWPGESRWVANITTKDHWKNPSHLEWISSALESLQGEMDWNKLTSVALPALGCGLGGLLFPDVRDLVHAQFEGSDLRVELYAP